MDQQAAAVHVPQEVVAQAGALAGALNDAGNVRHDEADAVLYPHHAQIGEQGGEVVVGDLGLGLGYHGEQRGLAHVGEAHQPGSPALAKRGTCRVGVAKWLLPQPPRPPLQRT
ncbi:Uncharacterised protein [uncultured Blautia sp.]|nr:Uncharacterised protein [uncultured Blautia sp.]